MSASSRINLERGVLPARVAAPSRRRTNRGESRRLVERSKDAAHGLRRSAHDTYATVGGDELGHELTHDGLVDRADRSVTEPRAHRCDRHGYSVGTVQAVLVGTRSAFATKGCASADDSLW
jgi:hypothetical protein